MSHTFPYFDGSATPLQLTPFPTSRIVVGAMEYDLLHPPAEVVKTGLPLGATPLLPPKPTLPEPKRIVAGPFSSEPPSSAAIPPGASYTRTAQIPPPDASSYAVGREVEFDEAAFLLGPQRGGKKRPKKAVLWEVIRSLRLPSGDDPQDQGDLPLLSTSLPSAKQNLVQIRHSHHQLAQMLATGTKQEECALITGYNPAYISILKGDPSFQDLISYYSAQREVLFVDAIERMRSLGLSTLDELQSRLEEDPTQFSNRELLEQTELMLVKPMAATRGVLPIGGARSNDGASGVQVNVNFIQTQNREAAPTQPDIIDMKPTRVP